MDHWDDTLYYLNSILVTSRLPLVCMSVCFYMPYWQWIVHTKCTEVLDDLDRKLANKNMVKV